MTTTVTFNQGPPAYEWDAMMAKLLGWGTWVNIDGALHSAHLVYGELMLEIYGPMELYQQSLSGGPVFKMVLRDGLTTVVTWDFTHDLDAAQFQALRGKTTQANVPSAIATLYGNEPVYAKGTSGNDKIWGGTSHDLLIGMKGNDTINGGGGLDEVRYSAEKGSKPVYVNLSTSTWFFAGGPTLKPGTAQDTFGTIDTLSNVEYITGSKKNDSFVAPTVSSDPNATTLFAGGKGADLFYGSGLKDGVRYDDLSVEGGGGKVIVNLSNAKAHGVAAGKAQDTYGSIDTLYKIDIIFGSAQNDTIVGGSRDEHLWGGAGKDLIKGNSGFDYVAGYSGNDTLKGGLGKDTIYGGNGKDSMTGGTGADQFVFTDVKESGVGSSKRDVITDFKPGVDKLVFNEIDADTTLGGFQRLQVGKLGTADSEVAKGTIGWYWIDKSGTANDKTIVRVNVDDTPGSEMEIELTGLLKLSAGDFIV